MSRMQCLFVAMLALLVGMAGCGGSGGGGGFNNFDFISTAPATVTATFIAPAASQAVPGMVGCEAGSVAFSVTTETESARILSAEFELETTGGATPMMFTNFMGWSTTTAVTTGSAVANPTTSRVIVMITEKVTASAGSGVLLYFTTNLSSAIPIGSSFRLRLVGFTAVGAVSGALLTGEVSPVPCGDGGITITDSSVILRNPGIPSYMNVATGDTGTTGVTAMLFSLRSIGEPVMVDQLEVELTNGSIESIVAIYINHAQDVSGSSVFAAGARTATINLGLPAKVENGDTVMALTADLAGIGVNQPGRSGEFIRLAITKIRGYGLRSGKTLISTGKWLSAGFRTFRSTPTVMLDTLSTNGVADGRILRARLTANRGDVEFGKFTVRITASGCAVLSVNGFMFTDNAYSQGVSGFDNGGQLMAINASPTSSGLVEIYPQTSAGDRTTAIVPGDNTRFLEIRAVVVVNPGVTAYSVVTTIEGDDTALPPAGMSSVQEVDGHGGRLIWSPCSVGPSLPADFDWANGYSLSGLPSSGLRQVRTN